MNPININEFLIFGSIIIFTMYLNIIANNILIITRYYEFDKRLDIQVLFHLLIQQINLQLYQLIQQHILQYIHQIHHLRYRQLHQQIFLQ